MELSCRRWTKSIGVLLCVSAFGLIQSEARASMVSLGSFVGAGTNPGSGHALSAGATFEWNQSTNQLVITLTNTSTEDYASGGGTKMVPTDVLTGLFFDVNPELPFAQANPFATVASGSTVVNWTGSGPAPTDVTGKPSSAPASAPGVYGGWQYKYNTGNNPSQNQGLGTAGFNVFDGTVTNSGLGNGFNYGLVNSGYAPGEGNNPVNGTPFIRSSVIFTLNGLTSAVSILNVRFQYGTDLSEPNNPGLLIPGSNQETATPEPGSLLLAGIAGLGISLTSLRRRRHPTVVTA